MTEEVTTETTEQPVDPQLQNQLDIRVTALVGYQSTLEVIEEPVLNGKGEEDGNVN